MPSASSFVLVFLFTSAAAPELEIVQGALSYVASKRCEESGSATVTAIEWPAMVYRARPQPSGWGAKRIDRCYVGTLVLSEAVGAGALWRQKGREAIEPDPQHTLFDPAQTRAAFKAEFGWELPDRAALKPNMFTSYHAKKVQALFDRLYLKPTDAIGQYKAQAVYDVFFKQTVTSFAQDVAYINEAVTKARLNKLLKEYQAAAKEKGEAFSAPDFLYQMAQTHLSSGTPPQSARNGRTLGIMLRRRADKTWPTVSKLMKKVLKDYDPALSQELAARL